jgi:hypothetical protein
MAIDYNKLVSQPKVATSVGGVDYNKIISGKSESAIVPKISTIPDFLGGGAYYNPAPGKLQKEPRTTYGGVKQTPGQQRDDIVPVSLGGANVSPKNIRLEPTVGGGANTKTDPIEIQTAADYKAGKISLPEARLRILTAKQRQIDGLRTTVGQQLFGALKDASKVVGDFALGIAKPFIKSGELLAKGGQTLGQVAKAGVQLAGGNKEGAKETIDTQAKKLLKERAKPMTVAGKEINRIDSWKDTIGTALELASYSIGAGEGLAAKNILKTTLTQGFKLGAKQAATRLAIGGGAMSLYSAGAAMQEDKSAKDIAISAAKGFPIGMAFEVGMLGVGAGGALIFKSFKNVIRGARPTNIIEKLAAEEGDKILPKTVKVGEEIKNASDPTISYEKVNELGVNESGEKILTKTEINPKTGTAKILVDKSLDATPGKKALAIEKELGDIIDGRLKGVELRPQTAISRSLESFGLKIGKPREIIAQDLEKETKKFGGLGPAIEKYKVNPEAIKKEAPTLGALLEHQTDPNLQIHTTSDTDLINHHISNMEKMNKAELPRSEGDIVTPRAALRLEAKAVEKDLMKQIEGLPEREVNHIKDQASEYAKLARNRQMSEEIAMGLKDAPGKLKASYVWVQEANRAAREGDVNMIQKLAKSPLVTKFSEEGSSIRMLREMDATNPVSVIEKTNKIKAKKFADSGKVEKTTKDLKEVARKSGPNKETWSQFIESIRC